MLRRAEAGDGRAMHNLGLWYEHGTKVLAMDKAKAFEWYEKSHEAGDAGGTVGLGWCYLLAHGVPKCYVRGAMLMCQAAERGSSVACYNLGVAYAYANGLKGFPKDKKIARRFYSMVASASIDNCTDKEKETAATWLRKHAAA
jgi:TPR repeat protein